MAIRQVKSKYATKDGRTWVVDITYRDYLDITPKSSLLEEKLKIMKQNIKLILKIWLNLLI